MMWDGDGWGHGGGHWMSLVLVFVLVAPIAAAFVVVWLSDRGSVAHAHRRAGLPPDANAEADRILRRRFAAGEIDEQEYHERQAALGVRVLR